MNLTKGVHFSPHEREKFIKLLSKYSTITVLSHIYPDPDAIGTSLGIYHILKKEGYRVEIANATSELPMHLNFLDGFYKIKKKIDYEESLIIACDCGSLDRLGFDLDGRDIINIDHHLSNTSFGTLNIVRPQAVSSSEVAYRFLEPLFEIPVSSAEAFYTALISDTRYFTTSNVNEDSFKIAQKLISLGVEPGRVAQAMLRRSLASLRILGRVFASLELYLEAKLAIMQISKDDFEATGAKYSDVEGIVDYARSLVTVDVAVLIIERLDSYKVSLRSKDIDILSIAKSFGGGGHRLSAGFEIKAQDSQNVVKELLQRIKQEGVISSNATNI